MIAIYYSNHSDPKGCLISFKISNSKKNIIAQEIHKHGYPIPDSVVSVFLDEIEIETIFFTEEEKHKLRVYCNEAS